MKLRRALLYMPAHDLQKVQKATTLGVDCICMDLEDSVAPTRKQEARQTALHALQTLDFSSAEKLVRVNPIDTKYFQEDIQTVLLGRPHGIVLPKVHNADDVLKLEKQIVDFEKRHDRLTDSLSILAIIESPLGILNLRAICQSSLRLSALIFGAEDLAVTLGATRTHTNQEVLFARSALVLHAAAFHLDAIDLVNNDYQNLEQLQQEAEQGAQMGYSGKQVIHPNQIDVVQKAFTPSPQKIAWAKEVVKNYEQQQQEGLGAIGVQGKLIDMPVYLQAKKIISRASAVTNKQA